MRNIWKWILGVVLVLIVFFALPFLFRGVCNPFVNTGLSGYPMLRGYGMMNFGVMPFGMWLIPLGTFALLIFGIVWLVKNLTGVKPVTARTCASCGKPAQADWKTCPYCGKDL